MRLESILFAVALAAAMSARAGDLSTGIGGAIGGAGCPVATPNRTSTWGQIKTIYR